ncbi:MAG: NifU family protein, partial [Geminicoccaceae bacterium]
MFIQTETTANPATLKFLPGKPVTGDRTVSFLTPEEAARSPLVQRLFAIEGVTGILLDADFIIVTRADDQDWAWLKAPILGAITEHYLSGQSVIQSEPAATSGTAGDEIDLEGQEPVSDAPQELIDQVRELVEARLRPAIHDAGGDIELRSIVGATVNLRLQGAAYAMLSQIAAVLRHYVPAIEKVQDVMDAIPKPGLATPAGK